MEHERPLSDHSIFLGYVMWVFGIIGLHRFYYGKPISGAIWALTLGLLFIGWIIDLFLIPDMADEATQRFPGGQYDYNLPWILLVLLGVFGVHRFYQGKILTGLLYLVTLGLCGFGVLYDWFTLNRQIADLNLGIE
ncbi:MAG: TM2 domain-containing protein [Halieaceae bacterium]|jgi:TM2 domain-containing membrane protein YozV